MCQFFVNNFCSILTPADHFFWLVSLPVSQLYALVGQIYIYIFIGQINVGFQSDLFSFKNLQSRCMYFIYTYVIYMCLYLYTYTHIYKIPEVPDCSSLLKEAFFGAQKGFCLFRHVQENQVKCPESCKQLWKQPCVLEWCPVTTAQGKRPWGHQVSAFSFCRPPSPPLLAPWLHTGCCMASSSHPAAWVLWCGEVEPLQHLEPEMRAKGMKIFTMKVKKTQNNEGLS